MSFVVDSTEWQFGDWSEAEIALAINCFLERIDIAHQRVETVWIGDDFQTRAVLGTFDLWSLRGPDSPVQLDPEVWQELSAWLARAPRYLDELVWPPGFEDTEISIDGCTPTDNPDVAWAHHSVRNGRAVGCISLRREGVRTTSSAFGSSSVRWVVDERGHREFWREAIVLEGDDASALVRLSEHAYPSLFFAADVWHGLNKLAGGYLALRAEIQRYFRVLDDDGAWAFLSPPPAITKDEVPAKSAEGAPSNQLLERRFQGLGLTVAPENPNVFLSKQGRSAREVVVGSGTLYCHWHCKLEPHRNRIHIHAPVKDSGGKVVIAVIHEHLPLP